MKEILRLSLPFTVWIVGFCAIYALQGLSCSRHWPETVDPRSALIAAAVVYVTGQGLVLLFVRRAIATSVFAMRTATIVAVAALAAALWVSLPVLALSVCD
jgi:hypothetical protein